MAKKSKNPLMDKQRETAGPNTFSKYLYQYHFGLFLALTHLEENTRFAIVMEYHEDVIFINGLDADTATFNFYQVKARYRKLNLSDLLSSDTKSSVLGKLLDSCTGRFYSSKIREINVVSAEGFHFKENIYNQSKFSVLDFPQEIRQKLEDKIRIEFGDNLFKLPDCIYFLTPSIKEYGHKEYVKSLIGDLVTKIYGDVYCKVNEIYTLLIDELYKKGVVTYSYSEWEEFMRQKTLTSDTIKDVVGKFIYNEEEREREIELDEILNEMGVSFMQKRSIKSAYKRYKCTRLSYDILQLDIKKEIRKKIEENMDKCEYSIVLLVNLVIQNISRDIANKMEDETSLKAAIIYEYLNWN